MPSIPLPALCLFLLYAREVEAALLREVCKKDCRVGGGVSKCVGIKSRWKMEDVSQTRSVDGTKDPSPDGQMAVAVNPESA